MSRFSFFMAETFVAVAPWSKISTDRLYCGFLLGAPWCVLCASIPSIYSFHLFFFFVVVVVEEGWDMGDCDFLLLLLPCLCVWYAILWYWDWRLSRKVIFLTAKRVEQTCELRKDLGLLCLGRPRTHEYIWWDWGQSFCGADSCDGLFLLHNSPQDSMNLEIGDYWGFADHLLICSNC